MKTKRFVNGFRNLARYMLPCILIFYACDQAEDVLPRVEGEVRPVHLSVLCENTSYSSDSEILPMRTKATDSYVVTSLVNHVLFIQKRVDDEWVIVEKREDVIVPPRGDVLRNEETLTLKEDARQYMLSPGEYRFLLFVNLIHRKDNNVVGDRIRADLPLGQAPWVTSTNNPPVDFFFAEDSLEVSKSQELQRPNDYQVHLKLKRKSALVRFILVEGENWLSFGMPTVFCTISGQGVGIGFDILGREVTGEMVGLKKMIDIKTNKFYEVGGQKWNFSSLGQTNNNLQLFADNERREIQLNVTGIGNANTGDYWFRGDYPLAVPVQENRITTLLIRKDGPNGISIELNPNIEDWNGAYPPLDYIELNNN